MKKYLISLFTIMMVTLAGLSFVSCSDDDGDDDNGGGKMTGWYIDLNEPATQSNFKIIDEAINNHELLASYSYGGQRYNYYATKDLFFSSDGMYTDTDAHFGRLRFSIQSQVTVIHVIDNTTLTKYYADLYRGGASSEDKVFKIYAGPIFGNMEYCGSPTYYTYAIAGNKIIVSNGDIYTISTNGLIREGTSSLMSKYDPNVRH